MWRWALPLWGIATVAITTALTAIFTEVPLWVTLAILGVMGVTSSTYLWFARDWLIAPAPLGLFRQLRDRVRTKNIRAAAQAATLAGDPRLAFELLGRYGFELCPSCATEIPSRRCTWHRLRPDGSRSSGDNQWLFVNVCPNCVDNFPSGWDRARFAPGMQWTGTVIAPTTSKVIQDARERIDVVAYKAVHRAQMTRIKVNAQLTRMRDRAERIAERARRRFR